MRLKSYSCSSTMWTPEKICLFEIHFLASKMRIRRTSLAAQWLGLHAASVGGVGLIPGWRARSHMPHGVAKESKTPQTKLVKWR